MRTIIGTELVAQLELGDMLLTARENRRGGHPQNETFECN